LNKKETPDAKAVVKALEGFYLKVGGVEAHKFGIQQGLQLAKKNIESDAGQQLQNLMNFELGLQQTSSDTTTSRPSSSRTDLTSQVDSGLSDDRTGQATRHRNVREHYDTIAEAEEYLLTTTTGEAINTLGKTIRENYKWQDIKTAWKYVEQQGREHTYKKGKGLVHPEQVHPDLLFTNYTAQATVIGAIRKAWYTIQQEVKKFKQQERGKVIEKHTKSARTASKVKHINTRLIDDGTPRQQQFKDMERDFKILVSNYKLELQRVKSIPTDNRFKQGEIKRLQNLIKDYEGKIAQVQRQQRNR
jgi:hypothetical protein